MRFILISVPEDNWCRRASSAAQHSFLIQNLYISSQTTNCGTGLLLWVFPTAQVLQVPNATLLLDYNG